MAWYGTPETELDIALKLNAVDQTCLVHCCCCDISVMTCILVDSFYFAKRGLSLKLHTRMDEHTWASYHMYTYPIHIYRLTWMSIANVYHWVGGGGAAAALSFVFQSIRIVALLVICTDCVHSIFASLLLAAIYAKIWAHIKGHLVRMRFANFIYYTHSAWQQSERDIER